MTADISSCAIHVTLHTGSLPELQTLVQEDANVPVQALLFQREGGYLVPCTYHSSDNYGNKEIGSTHGLSDCVRI